MSGFTLVELLVISPVLILMVTVMVGLLVNLTSDNLLSNGNIDIAADVNTALGEIEDDVTLSPRYLTTKDTAFSDPYGPDNSGAAWSYKGSSATSRVLITRTYATDTSPKDPSKKPVYISQYGCEDAVLPSNPVLETNVIYFVRNGTLYRRTLTDTSQTLCNPQWQRQTCPPEIASPQVICKAHDSILLTGVTDFTVQYYTNSGDTAPIDAYNSTDPAILNSAKTIVISTTSSRIVAGETLSHSSSIRISRLN